MNLVIVESPAKAKTIQKYLGRGFKVRSSYGHVRDLPKSKIGVDVENNFEPTYSVPDRAKKQVKELQKLAKQADIIYFATDEDREGEAIAWHLYELLKADPAKSHRITFDEITKTAILKAIKNPRKIDQALVDAQVARRVLDRLVGYELSPLLWKKVRRGLSAGRVQSVAVRLIAQREAEIEAFNAEEYWSLEAHLLKEKSEFVATLRAKNEKTIAKLDIKSKADMETILEELKGAKYTVTAITRKQRRRTPPPPFITSTLQQSSVNQLGFSSKKTMMMAQQLYEGIELGADGPVGLITYMRTDSTHLAAQALKMAKAAITKQFGPDYALATPRAYKKKTKGAQEAHEAIRPTDPARTPDDVAQFLTKDQLKVYRLIWQRMVASQMAEAKLQQVTADIQAGDYTFRAVGSTVIFDGYVRALGEKAAFKETLLPELKEKETVDLKQLAHEQHFTVPPARYSEATLVKALEEHGIGRPSTYAPTIDTIQKRGYVEKNEDRRFAPTEIGSLVNSVLTEHFPNIVDIDFTASMENDLDAIASGKKQWQPIIKEFYTPFHKLIESKDKELKKTDLTQEATGEKCPQCSHDLVIKLGRFGKFKACSNYPECKHTEPIGEEKELQAEHTGLFCPDCKNELVVKRGRFGPFLGCGNYPDCKYIKAIEKEVGVACPKCKKGQIIEKKSRRGRTFYACNQYPACENAYWSKPTGETCPDCQSLLVFGAKNTARCSSKECKFSKDLE